MYKALDLLLAVQARKQKVPPTYILQTLVLGLGGLGLCRGFHRMGFHCRSTGINALQDAMQNVSSDELPEASVERLCPKFSAFSLLVVHAPAFHVSFLYLGAHHSKSLAGYS